jgi:methylase of polypeptide subunit release factors
MSNVKPYKRALAGFEYEVLSKVYKGAADTALFCDVLKIKAKQLGAKYVLATDLNPNAVRNTKRNSLITGFKVDAKRSDLFGSIKKRFDVITFNPPYTDEAPKHGHDICFWDEGHRTVKKFFKELPGHLKPEGRAFIAWSSFGNVRVLKQIAKEARANVIKVGQRRGKRKFVYYVFKIEYN